MIPAAEFFDLERIGRRRIMRYLKRDKPPAIEELLHMIADEAALIEPLTHEIHGVR